MWVLPATLSFTISSLFLCLCNHFDPSQNNGQFNIALTTNSITALKNYVIAGHGISAMRYADIGTAVEAGQVDVLEIDTITFQQAKTQLLIRKGANISDSQRVLLDRIRASFNLR